MDRPAEDNAAGNPAAMTMEQLSKSVRGDLTRLQVAVGTASEAVAILRLQQANPEAHGFGYGDGDALEDVEADYSLAVATIRKQVIPFLTGMIEELKKNGQTPEFQALHRNASNAQRCAIEHLTRARKRYSGIVQIA
ncbi:MAG: hypothetical protein ABGZ35_20145 [Planctomycetaceae bacterium]